MKTRRKVKPSYKQMTFETAIRNPERFKEILFNISKYENRVLNDSLLLEIVCNLYINGTVSSPFIKISERTTIDDIKQDVIIINSTRRADGGFPSGYQSRFWTYMRTPSEFGFVYAQYNEPLKFSEIAKMLFKDEIDEQQAFAVQSMLCNRKSPYRNILNDYNYFRFILKVLSELWRDNKGLSFNQFILSTFVKTDNVTEFLDLIQNNNFSNLRNILEYIYENNIKANKLNTMFVDYPDVVLRLLRITGFIVVESKGILYIRINEDKIEQLNDLLKIDYSLTPQEKDNSLLYFTKINNSFKPFLSLIQLQDDKDVVDGFDYTKKLENIINKFNINSHNISKYIAGIGKKSKKDTPKEFSYIPEPLQLEFFISLLIFINYSNKYGIRPNYKMDSLGLPISHAPGRKGDIDVYSKIDYWLIEATLIRNKTQQINNETTSVLRHFNTEEFKSYPNKYLSFVAPIVHTDTKTFYEISILWMQKEGITASIKPYSIEEFVEVTNSKNNFHDMETYTNEYLAK